MSHTVEIIENINTLVIDGGGTLSVVENSIDVITVGEQGPQGIQGIQGIAGNDGEDGQGVPAGGTANQILEKIDGTDYNTQWTDPPTSAVWGNITGTLSSQTDLQTALDAKLQSSDIDIFSKLDAIVADKSLVNLEDGGTFTSDVSVPDEAYGVGWDGSLEVPTKNAIYDKIESLGGGGTPAGSTGEIQFNSSGSFGASSNLLWDNTNKVLKATSDALNGGYFVQCSNNSHTTQSPLITLRRSRGTIASPTSAFSGTTTGGIEWENHDGTTWRKGAQMLTVNPISPPASQAYAHTRIEFYAGSYDGTQLTKVLTLSGGSQSFVTGPQASFGDGTAYNGPTIGLSNSGVQNAYQVFANNTGGAAGAWSVGMLGSNNQFKICQNIFLNGSDFVMDTSTGNAQFGGVTSTTYSGAKLAVLATSGVCLSVGRTTASPTGTIAYQVASNFGTVKEITFSDNGAAVFNEQGRDADFRIEGDTDANLFFTDASDDAVKIAGVSTSKVGFFGATAVNRRSHIADPSGGVVIDTNARTAINAILLALEQYGLLATS